MSDNRDNGVKKRIIFNSKLALLPSPPPRYEGEWPKKPPYWRIYGTAAATNYWKIGAGFAVLSIFLSYATYYIQPKVNLGIIDRYLTPELFYQGEEKEKYLKERMEQLSRDDIFFQSFTREGSFDETTKEYRERLDSLEAALNSQKTFRTAAL